MSNGAAARRVSRQDIQLVQNLIERCLQLYMSQKEVVDTLLVQAKIEPGFTELVWQKLEEENREFFKAYYLRLLVKHQIIEFNKLLEQQVQLLHHINATGVAPMPTSNGSNIPSLHQTSTCYALEHTGLAPNPENIHCSVGPIMPNAFRNGGSSLPNAFSNGSSSVPNAFSNGGSSLNRSIHGALGMPGHASRNAPPLNMLPNQNSNIGLVSGMNEAMIKSEAGYSGNSSYTFGADENVLETRPMAGDASASYSNIESGAQPPNDSLLDADTSPLGFLGQIPRSFSLTDLTAEYSQSSDILESYPRSPFLSTDTNDFMDSRERIEHPGDNRRLDTISEALSLEDFGSE